MPFPSVAGHGRQLVVGHGQLPIKKIKNKGGVMLFSNSPHFGFPLAKDSTRSYRSPLPTKKRPDITEALTC
jgi:hypothetical protein